MEPKKKPFPKTKKKIRGFLTDESMNMSKKSVLGLALGSVLLYTGVNNVNAAHGNACVGAPSCSATDLAGNCACLGGTSSTKISVPVNGHFSQWVSEDSWIPILQYSNYTSHTNTYRPRRNIPASHSNMCTPSCSPITGNTCACPNPTPVSGHKSWIVNGDPNYSKTTYWVPSVGHSSHSNHGSGGWC